LPQNVSELAEWTPHEQIDWWGDIPSVDEWVSYSLGIDDMYFGQYLYLRYNVHHSLDVDCCGKPAIDCRCPPPTTWLLVT
jgi:hypothetical protein